MPNRIARPARLERIRCAIARDLFRNHLLTARFTLGLVPKSHPWRTLTESAVHDLAELTTTTLRPRADDGTVKAKLAFRPLWLRLASPTFVLKGLILYALLAAASRHVPPNDGFGLDDSIRIFDRLQSAGTAFFSDAA